MKYFDLAGCHKRFKLMVTRGEAGILLGANLVFWCKFGKKYLIDGNSIGATCYFLLD